MRVKHRTGVCSAAETLSLPAVDNQEIMCVMCCKLGIPLTDKELLLIDKYTDKSA